MCTVGIERRGFTLLELLVVLVIASLAISVVGPAFQHLLPGLQLETESRKLVATLRNARSQAILSGLPVVISQDADTGGLRLSYREQPYRLPATLSLTLEAGPAQGGAIAGVAQIRFYPRGDSSGGSLELKQSAGSSAMIRVDWLTGRVWRSTATDPAPPAPRQLKATPAVEEGEGDE